MSTLHGLRHFHFARGIQQVCFLFLAMRLLGDSFPVKGLEACELNLQHRWGEPGGHLMRRWQRVQWRTADVWFRQALLAYGGLCWCPGVAPSPRSQTWRPTATSQFPSHPTERRAAQESALLLAMSVDIAQLA